MNIQHGIDQIRLKEGLETMKQPDHKKDASQLKIIFQLVELKRLNVPRGSTALEKL